MNGSYLKALLISMGAYMIAFSITSPIHIDPMPGDILSIIPWIFGTLGKIIGYAGAVMTFSFAPPPLNWILSLFFGSLFIYGVIGLGMEIMKSIKIPFSG